MTISSKYLFSAVSVFIIIFSIACGMKGNPIPPEKVVIPVVADFSGVLAGDTVVFSWSPSLNYSNSDALELSAVEVYRFDQDVTESLADLKEREELQTEARKKAGLIDEYSVKEAAGEAAYAVNRLKMSPVQGFQDNAKMVARIPVEQLLDLAEKGKIFWKGQFNTAKETGITKRTAFAIREIDIKGKRSSFSNLVYIYPLITPPAPRDFALNYTQKSLNIVWDAPERTSADLPMVLIGFNIYKTTPEGDFPNSPINATLLTYRAPVDWRAVSLKSYQRIKGQSSNYALLFSTSNESKASGISQEIYSAALVNQRIGQEVDVEVNIRSIGKASPGRIILDASRDPKNPNIDDEDAVFRYDQNPLVQIENIAITNTLKTFRFSGKVPVGALGYQIIVEPRGWNPVEGSYVIESIKVSARGRNENLVRNGGFDASPALRYSEDITNFGGSYKYRMTAIYELADLKFESLPTESQDIVLKDIFPPDSPSSVRAQATFDSVSLTWNQSRAKDVEGYLVFRRSRDERKHKKLTAEPIKNTIYRDKDVVPGNVYFYQIRAIDKSGNVSKNAVAESVEVLKRN